MDRRGHWEAEYSKEAVHEGGLSPGSGSVWGGAWCLCPAGAGRVWVLFYGLPGWTGSGESGPLWGGRGAVSVFHREAGGLWSGMGRPGGCAAEAGKMGPGGHCLWGRHGAGTSAGFQGSLPSVKEAAPGWGGHSEAWGVSEAMAGGREPFACVFGYAGEGEGVWAGSEMPQPVHGGEAVPDRAGFSGDCHDLWAGQGSG